MKIMQQGQEILQLYEMILALRPRRVVEVGTARGGTLYLWTQAASDDAQIVSIDLPGGPFGGGYPACRMPFYRAFRRPQQTLHLLRLDSLSPDVPEQVRALFQSEPSTSFSLTQTTATRAPRPTSGFTRHLFVRAGSSPCTTSSPTLGTPTSKCGACGKS
jgi:cephalosporin hydroxylase